MYQERELVMTSEERIISLHERAKTLKRRRDRNILRVWGSLCAGLTTVLMIAAKTVTSSVTRYYVYRRYFPVVLFVSPSLSFLCGWLFIFLCPLYSNI